MFLLNANNHSNRGFNLAEISATLVVIGILAAVGVPNFLGMYERFQANSAFDQVRGAIQEAQLQAIRISSTNGCTLVIDEDAKTITVNDPVVDKGCLLQTVNLPDSTEIKSNGDGTVFFNFRGNTNTTRTIVVYDPNRSSTKCLVISNGIGMMRSGFYTGSLDADVSADSCDTQ